MKSRFILYLLGCALALSGCTVLEGDKIDYKSAGKAPTLDVPPDLTQLAKDTRFAVAGNAVTASSFKPAAGVPAGSTALATLGDVRIERSSGPQAKPPLGPGLVVQTQSLFLDARRERMSTDQAVQLQRGNDRMEGQRLQYDHLTQQLDLSGKVRMSITPTGRGLGEPKSSTTINRP